MAFHSKWFPNGTSADEKDSIKRSLYASKDVLERLYAILDELQEEINSKDLSLEEYSSPAYPYLKADRTGEKRAYSKIKQLLQFIKD